MHQKIIIRKHEINVKKWEVNEENNAYYAQKIIIIKYEINMKKWEVNEENTAN